MLQKRSLLYKYTLFFKRLKQETNMLTLLKLKKLIREEVRRTINESKRPSRSRSRSRNLSENFRVGDDVTDVDGSTYTVTNVFNSGREALQYLVKTGGDRVAIDAVKQYIKSGAPGGGSGAGLKYYQIDDEYGSVLPEYELE